jgi:hypothetical protein
MPPLLNKYVKWGFGVSITDWEVYTLLLGKWIICQCSAARICVLILANTQRHWEGIGYKQISTIPHVTFIVIYIFRLIFLRIYCTGKELNFKSDLISLIFGITVNHLKCCGYYMNRLFYYYKSLHLPRKVCLCVSYAITINSDSFPNSINWLIFVMERLCVSSEVWTEFLRII